ncbi:P1 family peptidase [Escherichia coli]|nr:P1 family peptidase [Escherichia coli]EJJ0330282.1 P1 family peptidase [Escherichia coli]EKY5128811.1 P1 family peptidase [Escherichia coli]HCQ0486895.1 P1 family peptidase [Escherichia coli]HDX6610935.1 P1 family peptidase [Escherichia coli]
MNFKKFSIKEVKSDNFGEIDGVLVGHAHDPDENTGCSVVIFETGAVCGVDVRGGAPGTRETDLLKPENAINKIHAITLSGGSAYGLSASHGVMKYLEENDIGYDTEFAKVPIVPAAVIYDLNFGNPRVRPDEEMGYRAAMTASSEHAPDGNTGAGTGATVGKMCGFNNAMKGGLGTASVRLPNGLIVSAMIVVNAVGEIRDHISGEVIAGMTDGDDHLANSQKNFFYPDEDIAAVVANTTIGVICTNAQLTKAEMTKVAQMSHDGLARTIYPIHTPFDGDTIFAASTGIIQSSVNIVGTLAAEVVAEAVLNGVKQAKSAKGYLAYSQVNRKKQGS